MNCSKSFTTHSTLYNHEKDVHEGRVYTCNGCQKRYLSYTSMMDHKHPRWGKPCNSPFTITFELKPSKFSRKRDTFPNNKVKRPATNSYQRPKTAVLSTAETSTSTPSSNHSNSSVPKDAKKTNLKRKSAPKSTPVKRRSKRARSVFTPPSSTKSSSTKSTSSLTSTTNLYVDNVIPPYSKTQADSPVECASIQREVFE